jgi:two-component system response regulator YesN
MPKHADTDGFERLLDNLRLVDSRVVWWAESYDTIPQMLETLVRRVRRYNRIILVDDDGCFQEIYNYIAAFSAMESTDRALENVRDIDSAKRILTPLFAATEDVELCRMLAIRLVTQFSSQLKLLGALDISDFFTNIYLITDPEEFRGFTMKEFERLLAEKEKRAPMNKSFVNRAIDYVRGNLDNSQLSVKWIAEKYLYMNVDYFSRQFVRETGEKFSAYLNRMRMEKAKELILQYDSSHIYEVAEQVGCGHNPQYFSQLFKKWTGSTPSHYRETHKAQTR